MENRVSRLEQDVADLKTRIAVAESSINDIKGDIESIKDDTRWTRRAITNAIITSVIAGVVGVLFAVLKLGGGM